jgi:hypothetical protein
VAAPSVAGGDQVSLEKHQTQIESVVTMLGEALRTVTEDSTAADPERILDLHHVWDFFRVKLTLRYIAPIRGFLDAADELAWATYHPAIRSANSGRRIPREPPLVFLDRGATPFASARGSSYRDLLPRGVRTRTGAEAASELPFPVIGMPWYLTGHLPGVLLAAHEVGHHIEDDCALTKALGERLSATGLPPARQDQWKPWLGEVFADVVASITCGEAYPTVLIDALASTPAEGAGMEKYPPPTVRARVCLDAISLIGLPSDPQLAVDGRQLGEPDNAEAEAQAVVTALLSAPYSEIGGHTLASILTSPEVVSVGKSATRLLAGLDSNLVDVRAVLSAASLAFARDPQKYDQRFVGRRAIEEVLALRPDGPRLSADAAARHSRDVLAGRTLARLLAHLPLRNDKQPALKRGLPVGCLDNSLGGVGERGQVRMSLAESGTTCQEPPLPAVANGLAPLSRYSG